MSKLKHALDSIRSDALTFGKIMPLKSMVGGKGRCREAQPWEFVPRTLKEAETFRSPCEPHGKHLAAWKPCISAPKVESFYERNMRLGHVGKR